MTQLSGARPAGAQAAWVGFFGSGNHNIIFIYLLYFLSLSVILLIINFILTVIIIIVITIEGNHMMKFLIEMASGLKTDGGLIVQANGEKY